ncbi:ABC transporter ATP-binding protein [Kaustia mangrovi]|uniref:ABC transporter ATP-binding protein n=1 Tax=Kaustia mangrovi TaxID=2593653 RepID=A0A7S8C873_9HYPH|nr:ABC transporter ATP-binding protein [Kaustia mangrovi]QPC45218.1 ABC transporter ATP-binding protein [Kaustia mangrovi]
MLQVQGLTVAYGPVTAVRGVDIAVHAGEVVALLGANGAGKTSTLNGIVGLAPVTGGTIRFRDEDVTGLPTERLIRRRLTLCPEGRRVFTALTVEENLRLGGYTKGRGRAFDEAVADMYDLFPILAERRRQLAGTLSGGQQQMLAIARALMSGPELLCLDEPSLGLAPQIVEQVFELITTLRGRGVTILLVEQNVALSLDVVDRAYLLASGEVAGKGTAEELKASQLVEAAYLGLH